MRKDAIGGYFALELPEVGGGRHADAFTFQSARAALATFLHRCRPSRIWVPALICDAVIKTALAESVDVAFYNVTADFHVGADVEVDGTDWLLYVNYFGVSTAGETDVPARFDPSRVILDRAQAFYASPALETDYTEIRFRPDATPVYDLAGAR